MLAQEKYPDITELSVHSYILQWLLPDTFIFVLKTLGLKPDTGSMQPLQFYFSSPHGTYSRMKQAIFALL